MTVQRTSPQNGEASRLAVTYSVLAGPLVWFAHFVFVYAVAEFGCAANFTNMDVISPSAIRTIIVLATVAACIAVGVAGVLGYRQRSALSRDGVTPAETRMLFINSIGLGFSVLFFVSIVFSALPVFFLSACGPAI
jgi:hypothetical protein